MDNNKINEILTRGIEDIIEKEHLTKAFESKKLRIKFGIDPTGPKIHLGRAIPLWKLRDLQELGHQIVLIIGDFTAQIGDPSDKLSKRPFLTEEEIKKNLENYKEQLGKILDLKKVEYRYNSEWLKDLTFKEIGQLAEIFSIQQMLARRNFKDRFEKKQEISLRECLYPIMQGYDSVQIKSDVEVGGFDQLFNLKAGRLIQKHFNQPEQDILTCKMLLGLDGRKMSTSWGNIITIVDEPNDMFGKIMSMHDELIPDYFLLCTKLPLEEVNKIKQELEQGANPRDLKARLAKEIVTLYHSKEQADQAEQEFNQVFKDKGKPTDIPEIEIKEKKLKLIDLILQTKQVQSKSEARRLIEQKAVKINDQVNSNWQEETEIKSGDIIQIGRRKFVKIK
ncbi:MAG: tyrosine--tRNA ligase [Patescibacteria group bacterium]|nr:tyrosine--tRNA ligase [Patescibacteria group bacterium]